MNMFNSLEITSSDVYIIFIICKNKYYYIFNNVLHIPILYYVLYIVTRVYSL